MPSLACGSGPGSDREWRISETVILDEKARSAGVRAGKVFQIGAGVGGAPFGRFPLVAATLKRFQVVHREDGFVIIVNPVCGRVGMEAG